MWVIALSGYDIKYLPRKTIKSQALKDFTQKLEKIADDEVARISNFNNKPCILFIDGDSNFSWCRPRCCTEFTTRDMIVHDIFCDFKATNKETEYGALIAGTTITSDLGAKTLKVYDDSLLIVSQFNVEFAGKDSKWRYT